ncbi:branched-chain amino acid ABC transporter permease [Bradyrhizobium sp. LHD-71]|uniref:branched-chain amino acid ABC transporter permease n=1 Tax=Bradyrhizobium sp. LHD-71 TaxID=3072141 RepID=UPI00280D958E|nr:branched-chain amino acid ABC transporter permease [Bradyrhizobium sp. LHD-71]MDQ8728200.1 branched-chain amino acid ABC transporter permease [Bradyrhizobium sp. LHD-71]
MVDLSLQLLVVGLSQAAIYMLVATGFALILSVSRIFHFAHAAVFALSGFLAFLFAQQAGLPFVLAVLLSAVLSCLVAVVIYLQIYTPLQQRSGNSFIIVLASIGLQFAIENSLALIWGTGGRYLDNPMAAATFKAGNVFIALTDIVAITVAVLGTAATIAFLNMTRLGRAMRAYSENPVMARVVGIEPKLVGAVAMAIGTALLVPAAVITGWYSSLVPTMGMGPLLYAVAAVVVGGIGSVKGAALGALMLGLLSAAISFHFPAFWSDAGAFLIMMVFVIWFPAGLFGIRARSQAAR